MTISELFGLDDQTGIAGRPDVKKSSASLLWHLQLYEAFPAAEARRLVERFEWHYTPKHGSWLDLAESELEVVEQSKRDALAAIGGHDADIRYIAEAIGAG